MKALKIVLGIILILTIVFGLVLWLMPEGQQILPPNPDIRDYNDGILVAMKHFFKI